jgi:hypothetical protein
MKDIGFYYKEEYRIMNYLHSYFPSWFSGYLYKYDKVCSETLGFQDWNEEQNPFFFAEDHLNLF